MEWQQNANMNCVDDGYGNWYLFVTAITHLLPAIISFLQDEMENIFNDVVEQFGRRTLCLEATTDDLKFLKGAEFKHTCSGSPFPCNTLLAIIMQETQFNCDFIAMLKGTDPQSWLTSPFEFSTLFLDEWTRSKFTGFDDFDITAIGQLVRRVKRLKQTFDENGFSYLLNARNEAMHSPTIKMSEQQLQLNFDAILSFLNHVSLNGRSGVAQAILTIKKVLGGRKNTATDNLDNCLKELNQTLRNLIIDIEQDYEDLMGPDFNKTEPKKTELNEQRPDESKINDGYSAKFRIKTPLEWLLSESESQYFLVGVLTGGIVCIAAMYRGDGVHDDDNCSRRCIEKVD